MLSLNKLERSVSRVPGSSHRQSSLPVTASKHCPMMIDPVSESPSVGACDATKAHPPEITTLPLPRIRQRGRATRQHSSRVMLNFKGAFPLTIKLPFGPAAWPQFSHRAVPVKKWGHKQPGEDLRNIHGGILLLRERGHSYQIWSFQAHDPCGEIRNILRTQRMSEAAGHD